jgi:tetratricopeptide (TPR) repeat protein
VAERSNAGLAVSGVIYETGDSLQFRVEIIDVSAGTPQQVVDETWSKTLRREAINRVGQRVSGVLWQEFDPITGQQMRQIPTPPTLEAYREYLLGMQLSDRRQPEEALEHLLRAHALDTMFIDPLLQAAELARDAETRDSFFAYVDSRRRYMSRSAQLQLDVQLAYRDLDFQAQLHAARELHRLDPQGANGAILHGMAALRLNLLLEALDALADFDPYAEWNRDVRQYWSWLASVYHMLGNHEQELVEARRARELHPNNPMTLSLEIQALAALGRLQDVRELLDEAPTLSRGAFGIAINAGSELRAHGHTQASIEAFEHAIEWLEARPDEEKERPYYRESLADALYGAERWAEARELYQGLTVEFPETVLWRGMVGVASARLGDTAQAMEMSAEIAEMSDWLPRRLYQQTRIAAVLGRSDEAMSFLREAFFEGHGHAIAQRRDMDLESLRDREDYKELMRPKG